MAKNSITDYSKTASLNTDIQSVDIDEGCLPSGINNAIRELMADLAAMNDGTVSLTSPSFAAASLTGDLSFGDNDKAIFGAGSDLQIYHDGSHSIIQDSGTGDLILQGGNDLILRETDGTTEYLRANEGAGVQVFHNGSQKLLTTSTGIDVTGTVTADGLTVDGDVLIDDGVGRITLDSVSGSNRLLSTTTGFGAYEDFEFRADNYIFKTSTTERLRIDSSGRVGIGTTSPDATGLHVHTGSAGTLTPNSAADDLVVESNGNAGITIASPDANYSGIIFSSPTDTTGSIIEYNQSGATFDIGTATSGGVLRLRSGSFSEAMRIDSSGNVGIGNTAIDSNAKLDVSGGKIYADNLLLNDGASSSLNNRLGCPSANTIGIFTNNSERMRIDSSGNLLVGKTISSSATVGITLQPAGAVVATRDGGECFIGNRKTSDGTIIQLRKDQATIGEIGAISSRPYISTSYGSDSGLRFDSAFIAPCTTTGSGRDNAIDLGDSGNRFKDLYLSGGVYLGGTGSANKLDDYEEGTWTPTFISTSTDPSVTYSTRNAVYRKVGSLVFVTFDMTISSYSGGSGNAQVGGFPFSQSGAARSVLFGRPISGVTTSNEIFIDLLSSTGFLTERGSGDMPLSDYSTSGFRIVYSGCYTTA